MSTLPDADLRAANRDVVRQFLARLEARDVDGFLELWHDDAVQEMPFAPEGFPDRLEGKADVRRQYGGLPAMMRSLRYPVRDLQTLEDPAWVVAQYEGLHDFADGSGHYNQRYIGVWQIEDGRIRLFREFFDPKVLTDSWGDRLGQAYSLEAE